MTPKEKEANFRKLLDEALNAPGELSQCYNLFYRYSPANIMEIYLQFLSLNERPQPVATYKRWQDAGRQVPGGSKARIGVWYPRSHRSECRDCEGAGRDEDNNKCETCKGRRTFQWTSFGWSKSLFTFDQTEAINGSAPTEAPAPPEWEADRVLEALGIERVPLELVDANTQGYAMPDGKLAVSPVADHPIRTTLHEIAHILHGHVSGAVRLIDGKDTPINLMEVEAEASAYIVSAMLGHDPQGRKFSRGYIQNWLGGHELPERSAKRIFSVAGQILKAVQGETYT